MGIKIIEADEPMEIDQIVMCLYGQPGIGKSTIGYSARDPLLLDFDGGASGASIHKATAQIRSWDDIEALEPSDLTNRRTLVVDTVGALLRHKIYSMISEDPKMGSGSSRQSPSQRGWGKLGGDFGDWLEEMKLYGLDIVLLCHSREITVDGEPAQRLQMPGQMAENIVYQAAVQIGHIAPYGRDTVRIQWSPTQATYGKDRAELDHTDVPEISQFDNYNWLGGVIADIRNRINEKHKGFTFPEEDDDGNVELTDGLLSRLTDTALMLREQRDRKRQIAFAAQLDRLGARWDSESKQVVRIGEGGEAGEDEVIVDPDTGHTTTDEGEQDAAAEPMSIGEQAVAEAMELEGQQS